jgi:CDP-diglyceride synthetase
LGVSWPYKDTARIILACVVMALGVAILCSYLRASSFIPLLVLVGAVIYLVQLPVLRVLRREDLKLMGVLWSRIHVATRLGCSLRQFQKVRPAGGAELPSTGTRADRPGIAEAGEPGGGS